MHYFHYPNIHMPTGYGYYDAIYRNGGRFQEILAAILEGIKGEAAAIDFYTSLVKDAPDKRHRHDIEHALEDEKIHLKEFIKLYKSLSGQNPKYDVKKKQHNTYREGLRIAYEDELEAYENYRNSYLLTESLLVRDVFFRAMTDEIEHATRFGFLLMELNKER